MSRILIAGCGDLGAALGERLCAQGHEVWGLRRSQGPLPAGIRTLRADLTRARDLDGLPDGLEAAFYIVTADAFDDSAYEAAYVRGAENLLKALASGRQALERFVYVSSTSVYGQNGGEWVDEDSPTEPRRFAGRRLLEAEALVRGGPVPGTVVRFGGIYGRRARRLLERVRGASPCQEHPPLYTNRIHRDDCVGILEHLLGIRSPEPVYLGVDSDPAPQCEVMDWLAARVGVPAPPRVDAGTARGMGKRCRNARLLASGYRLRYPSYRDGYGAVLEDSA